MRGQFLLGLALLFWGWSINMLIPTLFLAIAIELPRRLPQRWLIDERALRRVSDISVALFIIVLIRFALDSKREFAPIFATLQWTPAIFLPLILIWSWHQNERWPKSVFLWMHRKKSPLNKTLPGKGQLNFGYGYFFLCLMAAGINPPDKTLYFFFIALLMAMFLWRHRSPRTPQPLWFITLIFACSLGFITTTGLEWTHKTVREKLVTWFSEWMQNRLDPSRVTISLGDVGQLKLSDEILFRVEHKKDTPLPILLREAAYNFYNNGEWLAAQARFHALPGNSAIATWTLAPAHKKERRLTIYRHLIMGKQLAALPAGTTRVVGIPTDSLKRNEYGAVNFAALEGLAIYQAYYHPQQDQDSPPVKSDYYIPEKEKKALDIFLKQRFPSTDQKITLPSPENVAATIKNHFQRKFDYDLKLISATKAQSAIGRFLLEKQAGHCELFATATTLLLRKAGIPARYVVGYSAQEMGETPRQLLVRSRHAHAWTRYYNQGRWWDLDTTPPSWGMLEAENASIWQPLKDFIDQLWFKLTLWRTRQGDNSQDPWLYSLIALLLILLAWRLKDQLKTNQKQPAITAHDNTIPTIFHPIEQKLNEKGLKRSPGEPLKTWIKRIEERKLILIINRYYHYRFHPHGKKREIYQQIEKEIQQWLEKQATSTSK
ncbi:transglutaminase-like domain-containing protein [Magnetococcales bacterium HHB-1]